jgi:hypothetical protein
MATSTYEPVRTMSRQSVHDLGLIFLLCTSVAACGPQPTQPLPTGDVNVEGLREVSARNFESAFIRPGLDFSLYNKLMVNELELAFRTPDRTQNQFPLGEDQKTRFRAEMAVAFGEELGKMQNLELVTEPGPEVLDLNVRVQDIVAGSPGTRVGAMGRASFALETVGQMTLVLELRDSESEEVLVRVFDRRAVEGAAMLSGDNVISTWEGVERVVARWASRAKEGLDNLVSGNY